MFHQKKIYWGFLWFFLKQNLEQQDRRKDVSQAKLFHVFKLCLLDQAGSDQKCLLKQLTLHSDKSPAHSPSSDICFCSAVSLTHTLTQRKADNCDSAAEFLTLLWNFFFPAGVTVAPGYYYTDRDRETGLNSFLLFTEATLTQTVHGVFGRSRYLNELINITLYHFKHCMC